MSCLCYRDGLALVDEFVCAPMNAVAAATAMMTAADIPVPTPPAPPAAAAPPAPSRPAFACSTMPAIA